MSVVRCLPTVRFGGFTAALCTILTAVVEAATDITDPHEILITAGSNGEHLPFSRHYTFEALDLRTHNFPSPEAVADFIDRIKAKLPKDRFTVLFEDAGKPNSHLHLQPVKGSVFP